MATQTENLGLVKPALTDSPPDITSLNGNWDKIDAALKGLEDGKADLGEDGKIPASQLPEMDYVPNSEKGAAGGVASLGADGKVPAGQLPSMDYAAAKHASQHASGGSDPVTPVSIGAAEAGHKHSAADITSGTLPISRGGTGATTAPEARENLGISLDGLSAASKYLTNMIFTAASTDGVNYTVTVPGLSELTVGAIIIIIPQMESTSISPKLNVNNLGNYFIRNRLPTGSSRATTGPTFDWLSAYKPVALIFDGENWLTSYARSDANSLYGTVPITSGGTGATTAASARTKLGITPSNIGAAPAYTYGTTDLTAGTSTLANGTLYFQYE